MTRWSELGIRLGIGGERVELRIPTPLDPVRARKLLPVFQRVAGVVADAAARKAEARGRTVSCKAECGACCRQLVPISPMEARHLRDVVSRMPEPRRSEVRARFARARERLDRAALLAKLQAAGGWAPGEARRVGLEYFSLGVPCPFFENESCSIHPERPIACREYLVTSPPENCARPAADTVETVELSARPSAAVSRLGTSPAAGAAPWVPLILAPEWAEAHPEEEPARPGQEILREFFDLLTGRGRTLDPEAPAGPSLPPA